VSNICHKHYAIVYLLVIFNDHVEWFCLLQDYIFLGTNQGPAVDIYNKTNFEWIKDISGRGTSGFVVDMVFYSGENQPQVNSKLTER